MADSKRQSNRSLSVSHLFIHSVVILFALAILINPAASLNQASLSPSPQAFLEQYTIQSRDARERDFCIANKDKVINNYFFALFIGIKRLATPNDFRCVHLMKKNQEWFRAKAWGRIGDYEPQRRYIDPRPWESAFNDHLKELETDDRDIAWVGATYLYFVGLSYRSKNIAKPIKEIVRRALHPRFGPWLDKLYKILVEEKKDYEDLDDEYHVKRLKAVMEEFSVTLAEILQKGEKMSESRLMWTALQNSFMMFPGAAMEAVRWNKQETWLDFFMNLRHIGRWVVLGRKPVSAS